MGGRRFLGQRLILLLRGACGQEVRDIIAQTVGHGRLGPGPVESWGSALRVTGLGLNPSSATNWTQEQLVNEEERTLLSSAMQR